MAITDKKEDGGSMICINSLVSQRTGEGVVEIVWGDKRAQLSCDEARRHAMGILECAEAGETDAFIVEFLQKIGTSKEAALKTLVDFRAFRNERQNKQ